MCKLLCAPFKITAVATCARLGLRLHIDMPTISSPAAPPLPHQTTPLLHAQVVWLDTAHSAHFVWGRSSGARKTSSQDQGVIIQTIISIAFITSHLVTSAAMASTVCMIGGRRMAVTAKPVKSVRSVRPARANTSFKARVICHVRRR